MANIERTKDRQERWLTHIAAAEGGVWRKTEESLAELAAGELIKPITARQTIDRMVKDGWLERVKRGHYKVASPAPTEADSDE